jgi:uncharacterized membrane protein YeaQ/YmgE (transglycosylase-associated protein family)
MGIIAWIVFGFIIGLIARAVVPGKQSMGFVLTTLLGIAGSVIGGLIASVLFHSNPGGFSPSGFFGSLVGAIVLLLIWGAVTGPRKRLA